MSNFYYIHIKYLLLLYDGKDVLQLKKFYTMLFICLLSFTLAVPASAFNDVPKTHPNYADIMYLVDKGVIQDSATFGIKDIVTREEVAVMIAKALGLNGATAVDTQFKDVAKTNKNSGYIQAAANAGIINGYDDGTFRPANKVTRGHMAAFIARAFKLPAGTKTFKDVGKNHTAYAAVSQLAAAGITTGYDDGTFKPQNHLSRAHIAAFLTRAIKYANGEVIAKPTPKPEKPKPDVDSGTYVIPGAPTSFKNCDAMRKYYPSGVQKGHPAYSKKQDRDNDNWACEK